MSIAGKYLTGRDATWGEGDWDAEPAGALGNPREGDGVFNQIDIVAALKADAYLTGPYAAQLPVGLARRSVLGTTMTNDIGRSMASVTMGDFDATTVENLAVPEPSTVQLAVAAVAILWSLRFAGWKQQQK